MPQLDLTTLSGPELRQLLDSARSRGQAAQSYEILQEMARRREAEPGEGRRGRFGGRRRAAGEPHVIDLDLGDPLEPTPEPWEVDAQAEVPPLAFEEDDGFVQPPAPDAAEADVEPPLTLAREPEAGPSPRRAKPRKAKAAKPAPPPRARPAQRPVRRRGAALGFALGGLAGIVLGIGVGGSLREALALPAEPEEPAPMSVAQLPPPPPPLPEPAVVAEAQLPAEPQLAEAELPATEALAAATDAVDSAPTVEPEPAPEPIKAATPKLEPVKAEAAKAETADACAAEPTPADRTICGDRDLQRLQKDLRQAYARALAAHADRDVLRQRQLAWRDARSELSDPGKLTALYEARIRKLNAATADARSRR